MVKMDFDLSLLHAGSVSSVCLDGVYSLPMDYYENTDILELGSIHVIGNISRKENEMFDYEDYIECTIEGTMMIADSISLEKISYPFQIEYNDFLSENCINNKNTLDIFLFLWENIVLEVPLYFTKVNDISKFHGDGWKLVYEDEQENSNNPFSDLLKDFEEE